ncbi:WbqC family protein [Paenibacillus sp. sgz5001063]|uniref:WbqC family protein n=1 Tax=Paenibacillus sp. sgz5001063 TaxID=3242474 RepID=UPI0036D30BD2
MKIAVMQPYLFPYIGYFQLINCVDYFIVYDDVQYIKGGWINRNRILLNKDSHLFSFSVEQASLQLDINKRVYSTKLVAEQKKFIKTLQIAYRKAPFCNEVIDLIKKIFISTEFNVSLFNASQLKEIADFLGVKTKFLYSSELDISRELKAEERIIDICKKLGADQYVNPIGGQSLYSKDHFSKAGIDLNFLKTKDIYYQQLDNAFIPFLSIIDVLMFNSKDEVVKILNEYELI